jgi:hypothetical protein
VNINPFEVTEIYLRVDLSQFFSYTLTMDRTLDQIIKGLMPTNYATLYCYSDFASICNSIFLLSLHSFMTQQVKSTCDVMKDHSVSLYELGFG